MAKLGVMGTSQHWRGVRLRTIEIGSDPDAPSLRVAIPAVWEDRAAAGFVGICGGVAPGWTPVRLPDAASAWIERLAAAGRRRGLVRDVAGFVDTLHGMLLLRQGCPDAGVWHDGAEGGRGFVLNLASFADPDSGFDRPGFGSAVEAGSLAASVAGGSVRIADLDGMLARLGLGYESEAGRSAARDVVRLARAAAQAASVGLSADEAGWAEALLGVETAGFAPAFSPVGADGGLTLAAQARLAALGLSPERALAMALEGEALLRPAGVEAHAAMHDALVPLLDATPVRPACVPRLAAVSARPGRRALPARSKGFTQKVTIGGHRLFLRTAEYGDGSLGEIAITLAGRENGPSRGMADAVASAVSIGLQHGVPLDAFVDAFAHGRFGASGAVEGDPSILSASSPLDYVMRALADAYLGRHLADPAVEDEAEEPLLPLGLGGEANGPVAAGGMRQRALRLVSPA